MRRLPLLLAGLVLASCLPPSSPGQPGPFPGRETFTFSLPTLGLLFVESPDVQRELGLSPDKARALTAYQALWFKRYAELRPSELKDKAKDLSQQAEKALADLLEEKQRGRLREITLQQYARQSPVSVLRLAEVREALGDTQPVGPVGGPDVVKSALTTEQYPKWEKLVGAEFKPTVAPSFGGQPRLSSGFIPEFPILLDLALQASVRTELKTTPEQNKKLDAQRAAWAGFAREYSELAPANANAARAAKAKEVEAAVAAALEPAQLRRLRQIECRAPDLAVATDPTAAALLLTRSRLGPELGLDDKQRDAARQVANAFAEEEARLLTSGKPFAEVEATVKQLDQDTTANLAGLLTAAQKQKLPDLLGEPFAGPVRRTFPGPGQGPGSAALLSFVSSAAVLLLDQESVRKELKVTPEQAKRVRDAWTAKSLEALPANLEKTLGPAARRLRQIALQQIAEPTGGWMLFLPPSYTYAEIAGPLKLTPGQKEKIDLGEKLVAVLTSEQLATWKEMAGEPFAGRIEPVGGFPGSSTEANLLSRDAVARELKLRPEQVKQVAQIQADLRKEALARPPDEATKGKIAAAGTAARALLTPEQATRFDQLLRQQDSAVVGLAVFLTGDGVRKEVALEDGQVAKLIALREEFGQLTRLRNRPAIVPRFALDTPAEPIDLEKAQRERMLAVLNPKQQTLLKNLLGEPLDGLVPAGRGGRGGFGNKPPLPPGFQPG